MATLMPIDNTGNALLCLLQLASPALPVGAYSYSEGLETLVDTGTIENEQSLKHWLEQELRYGAIRLEAAVMVRAYKAAELGDSEALGYWNAWASAARETEELRQQSWQMGQSLMRLLLKMQQVETRNRTSCRFAAVAPCFANANVSLQSLASSVGNPCNFAIAFGLAAEYWQINAPSALLGYLHSWASNLITNGVKLIPLGQTAGQQLLLELHEYLSCATEEILTLRDDDLTSCGWGLALASMAHETQYTRLFRS